MKKRRLKKSVKVFILLFAILICIIIYITNKPQKMISLINKNIEEVIKYAKKNDLILETEYEYNDETSENNIIEQSIRENAEIKKNDTLKVLVSKGKIDVEQLKNDKINELGNIPVMMYHGIINTTENKHTGGNVDVDGYNRTSEYFRKDLEFYYQNGYRMIRLNDYVTGNINVEYGKSPIVLTFDDGNANNILVTGEDENGNIIIDPNSAVGILEEFKAKYPDYNVTATFFITSGLFNQPKYNKKIMNWLVDHNYDIGNHTKNHVDFTKVDTSQSENEVGYMYNQLEQVLGDKYVKIVALPFGSPYLLTHENMSHILNATYNNKTYTTVSALRVGWEPDASPFSKNFNPHFIKRCRAYDNNNNDFDIEFVFNRLKTSRYISDGDNTTVVIPETQLANVKLTNLRIIKYTK